MIRQPRLAATSSPASGAIWAEKRSITIRSSRRYGLDYDCGLAIADCGLDVSRVEGRAESIRNGAPVRDAYICSALRTPVGKHGGAQAIKAGEGDVFIAGGVESMTRAPYVTLKSGEPWSRRTPETADTTVGWRFTNPRLKKEWTIPLGETAELVAQRYKITRAEQDAFAVESQRRAEAALKACVFTDELVPVPLPDGTTFARDEYPRAGTTLESVAEVKPAFTKDGTVTAASSSGINDGAAALLLTGEDGGRRGRLTPLARVVATAVAGVDPSCMGLGPIPATQKVLQRSGLTVEQMELIEVNEAFAAQAIACIRELRLDPAKVNIYGGAIALGHPLGATGARILTTLVHALRRTNSRYGLCTMCIGVGQGIAMVVERA